MTESFSDLIQNTTIRFTPGNLVHGKVIEIGKDYVLVDADLKSYASIPVEEFLDENNNIIDIQEGEVSEFVLDAIDDGTGATVLSRRKAREAKAWIEVNNAMETGAVINGLVMNKIKGGYSVYIMDGLKAFLPRSLVDVKPPKDDDQIIGKRIEIVVKKITRDRNNNNIVISRKEVLQMNNKEARDEIISKLEEGQIITGIVKNTTNYGAFVDLGGVDGLLHLTDMSWKRVRYEDGLVKLGDEVTVVIMKIDREQGRISLSMKQLQKDPWHELAEKYPVGTKVTGKVTNIVDYGCFVEIEQGVEGLVHLSEMDWTNKNVSPAKIVQQVGQETEVVILDINPDRKRISLGIKQCFDNPWTLFSQEHAKGDKITGKIRSITDFGLFVGLDRGIDGLIHISDIPPETSIKSYNKGDEITAVVLGIDPERERISLGIKQLNGDKNVAFLEKNPINTKVTGNIVKKETNGYIVDLGEESEGFLKKKHKTKLLSYEEGDSVKLIIKGLDKRSKYIQVWLDDEQQDETMSNPNEF